MNCYDFNGSEIDCMNSGCIGQDCYGIYDADWFGGVIVGGGEGNPGSGDTQELGQMEFGADYADFGLEGLFDMNEQEFNTWFQDYLPWGDYLPGYTEAGAENPVLIDPGQAAYLASLFPGYDNFQEYMLNTEMYENASQMNMMLDAWDESSDLILASKEARDLAITDKKQELYLQQESLEDEMSAWKNKAGILEIVKAQRASENKNTKPGVAGVMQDKVYSEAVVDTLTKWYSEQDFRSEAFKNKADLLDQRTLANINQREMDKEEKLAIKSSEIQSGISEMALSNLQRIQILRDDYEADIYDQLAMFGSSQAFFDVDTPDYSGDNSQFEEDCWIGQTWICG